MTEQRRPEPDPDPRSSSWAPATASDVDMDDSPFGSVLGDPLMGSMIFDVSVLDFDTGSIVEDVTPDPPAAPGAERPGAPSVSDQLRDRARAQQEALRSQVAGMLQASERPERPAARPAQRASQAYGVPPQPSYRPAGPQQADPFAVRPPARPGVPVLSAGGGALGDLAKAVQNATATSRQSRSTSSSGGWVWFIVFLVIIVLGRLMG